MSSPTSCQLESDESRGSSRSCSDQTRRDASKQGATEHPSALVPECQVALSKHLRSSFFDNRVEFPSDVTTV